MTTVESAPGAAPKGAAPKGAAAPAPTAPAPTASRSRSKLRDAGRALLVAAACTAGLSALRLVTLAENHGCVQRGTFALHWTSRLLLRGLRIRVLATGALRSGPSLVVANGETWLDAVVLAAAGPMRPLVDPQHLHPGLIGAGVRRAGVVCAGGADERGPRAWVDATTLALRRGHRVLAFPCRTAAGADGPAALRVHPAIIQAAVDAGAVVAPVAIDRRIPIDGSPRRPGGARTFAGALWRILRAGPATVHVHWLPVIPAIVGDGHRSRHRARTADRVARAITTALAGQLSDQPDLPASATSTPATAKNLLEPRSRTVLMPRLSRSA